MSEQRERVTARTTLPSATSEGGPRWQGESAEWTSLAWEASTGADSIATIERVYDRHADSGAYRCCWPECSFSRRDPEVLWRHVHSAHGRDDLPPADFDPGPWL